MHGCPSDIRAAFRSSLAEHLLDQHSENPMIALSGVRSSCDMLARNSDLCRFAVSICRYRRPSSSLMRFRFAASAPSSSRLTYFHQFREVAGRDLVEACLHLPDRTDQRPRDGVAEDEGKHDAAERENNDDVSRVFVRLLARLDARDHVRLGLVDQLVGQPLQALGKQCARVA